MLLATIMLYGLDIDFADVITRLGTRQSCPEWKSTERKVIEGLVFAITVRVATYFK